MQCDKERKSVENTAQRLQPREAERMARLERLAAQETVRVQRNRAVAFIPFGAGQFQNGDRTLGWGFLAAEAAFVAIGTAVERVRLFRDGDVRPVDQPLRAYLRVPFGERRILGEAERAVQLDRGVDHLVYHVGMEDLRDRVLLADVETLLGLVGNVHQH